MVPMERRKEGYRAELQNQLPEVGAEGSTLREKVKDRQQLKIDLTLPPRSLLPQAEPHKPALLPAAPGEQAGPPLRPSGKKKKKNKYS